MSLIFQDNDANIINSFIWIFNTFLLNFSNKERGLKKWKGFRNYRVLLLLEPARYLKGLLSLLRNSFNPIISGIWNYLIGNIQFLILIRVLCAPQLWGLKGCLLLDVLIVWKAAAHVYVLNVS